MPTTKQQLPDVPPDIDTLFSNLNRYAHKIGEGNQAEAFQFYPFLPGFDKFVIRIPKLKEKDESGKETPAAVTFKKLLHSSTSLTPASHIVSKIHIGNRLMELDSPIPDKEDPLKAESGRISIHLFQEGQNLEKWQQNVYEMYDVDHRQFEPDTWQRVRASIDTINTIKEVVETKGFNPYVRMFKKAYALGWEGLEADIHLRNILYSKEKMTLRMVDQENRFLPEKKQITNEKQAQERLFLIGYEHLKEFDWRRELKEYKCPLPPELQKQYDDALGYIKGLLTEAYEEAKGTAPNRDLEDDGSGMFPIPRRITYAKVDSAQGVSLKKPPHTLLEQLNHIVKTADITR